MKKLIAFAIVAAIHSSPALAINAQYRAQLERSGCTEMNAGTTCDIHKTVEQNERNARRHGGNNSPDVIRAHLNQMVVGSFRGEAVDVMESDGWTRISQDGTKYRKGEYYATLVWGQDDAVASVVVR